MTAPTRTPLATRSEFAAAIRSGFREAAESGATEIIVCDRDFAAWPLGERAVIESLTRWAGPRRRLLLLAHAFDAVPRQHGRWMEWRRQWSHLVECRSNDVLDATELPTLLLVPGRRSVRVFDPSQHRGIASSEAVDEAACREAIDAVLQQSVEAFPATTLGL